MPPQGRAELWNGLAEIGAEYVRVCAGDGKAAGVFLRDARALPDGRAACRRGLRVGTGGVRGGVWSRVGPRRCVQSFGLREERRGVARPGVALASLV